MAQTEHGILQTSAKVDVSFARLKELLAEQGVSITDIDYLIGSPDDLAAAAAAIMAPRTREEERIRSFIAVADDVDPERIQQVLRMAGYEEMYEKYAAPDQFRLLLGGRMLPWQQAAICLHFGLSGGKQMRKVDVAKTLRRNQGAVSNWLSQQVVGFPSALRSRHKRLENPSPERSRPEPAAILGMGLDTGLGNFLVRNGARTPEDLVELYQRGMLTEPPYSDFIGVRRLDRIKTVLTEQGLID